MSIHAPAALLAILVGLHIARVPTSAQSTTLPAPEPASVIHASDWEEVLAESRATDRLDIKLNETNVRGGTVRVGVIHRTRDETRALIHDLLTEVYYIVEGSGTLITGGEVEDSRAISDPPNLGDTPNFFVTQVGGARRSVGPGDIIVIPAGLPHRLVELEGPMSYLIYRFQGD